MQGMQVQSLVWELSSHMPWGNWACAPQLESLCAATTKPTRHNYWALLRDPLISKDNFYLNILFSIFKGFVGKERHILGNLASAPSKASFGLFQAVSFAIHFRLF